MNAKLLRPAVKAIVKRVEEMHVDRRSWNANCGQLLVYGTERLFGFAGAIGLESVAETAWKEKADIEAAVFEYLKELYSKAGKWSDDV